MNVQSACALNIRYIQHVKWYTHSM
jgi:hypothetical protein